ncbi:MAG: hypothetical protein ACP6IS_07635 [Candidatus Asgardarchaeia archaeon]
MRKKQYMIALFLFEAVLFASFMYVFIADISQVNVSNKQSKITNVSRLESSIASKDTMNFRYMRQSTYTEIAYDVATDDHAFYIVGTKQKTSAYTETSIFIEKISKTGEQIWNYTYELSGYRGEARGVCIDINHPSYFYVTGYVENTTGNYIILLKMTRDGTPVWSRLWGPVGLTGTGVAVAVDFHNGIYVTGYNSKAASNDDRSDIITLKYTSDGNLVWNATYDSSKTDFSTDIFVSSSGAVTVVGAESNGTYYKGLILRYDKNGNQVIRTTLSDSHGSIIFNGVSTSYAIDEDYIYITAQFPSGNNYVAGLVKYSNDTLTGGRTLMFPYSAEESIAYGISYRYSTLFITGYVKENNSKNVFLWQVNVGTFNTASLSIYNDEYDGVGYGIAELVSWFNVELPDGRTISQPKIVDYVVAGATYYSVEGGAIEGNYTWEIWSPDTDSDNLSNFWELKNGTSIINPDSDNDAIEDGIEVYIYHSNPLCNDTDSDNITDGDEINTFNTSPISNDTDSDNITDYEEIFVYYTNVTNPDTDGDSLTDYMELFVYHTNPKKIDTDNDGMPDNWEIQYGLNATNPEDANEDSDNDGLTNLQEFQEGKNPTVDDVPPVILSMWTQPNLPNNATETKIYAKVNDLNGISSVVLTYYVNGEKHTVNMKYNSTSDEYFYSLGILNVNINVTYYIIATDIEGNNKTSQTYTFIVAATYMSSTGENNEGTGGNQLNMSIDSPFIIVGGVAVILIVVAILKKRK